MRRVVITGLGVISPAGIGKEAFWNNLLNGVSGATTLDRVTCSPL
ncbi:MAG TPA: beta-ketoacyl synthase N-terminal-like domain-containing protein, partial [Ktedonobacteraceae bacterium]|nr:beta-ketoacyl synthase N-terminal-like domain-containing protein [Ktedonobacteraceae bacterium]